MLAIEQILTEISPMKAIEKIKLVDEILSSLNQPNPKMDEIWAKEAEDRLKAYNDGSISSISAQKVFDKYRK